MESGVVRKITPDDLGRIIELERKCFDEYVAYTPRQLKYLITMANSSCLAETIQEKLRGFVIVLYKKGTVVAGIETLNVDPVFQGNGIGKKLLKAAEEVMCSNGINKIRLEVSVGNISAVKLYEKSGFRKVKKLKNYYYYKQYGSNDAYRMVKDLTT